MNKALRSTCEVMVKKADKIKILHAIRQGKIGGGESHVIDLVKVLDNEMFESVVLSFTDGPMVSLMRQLGIKTYVIATEKPFDFMKWGAVKRILRAEKIDVVHAHGTRANSNTFFSAAKIGIPLLYTVHGWSFHPDQSLLVKKLRIMSERFLVKKATFTICVSDSNLRDGTMCFPIKRARVVKCGIDRDRFNPNRHYVRNIRQEFHMSSQTTIIGYIARVTLQKDPITLVKAVAMIPPNLDVKVLFVGDGDLKTSAMELATELGVGARIIFADFRQDIPDILNAIDIYCLPSLWEGLPIGLLEAMAMNKAVVTTAVDGIKEVIDDGRNGMLVPVRSPEKLAEILTRLILNPKLRASLGNEAKNTILEEYDVGSMTRKIEDIYRELIFQR